MRQQFEAVIAQRGVSAIRWGERDTLALVLHGAA